VVAAVILAVGFVALECYERLQAFRARRGEPDVGEGLLIAGLRYELHRRLTFDPDGNLINVQEPEEETRVFVPERPEMGERPVVVTHPEFAAELQPRYRASLPPTPQPTPLETNGITVSDVLDGVQAGLDVVGLIPGPGEIADGINAVVSLGRRDYMGAALSAAAMIPFAGWGATAAKFVRRIIDLGGSWVRTAARHSDEVADLVEATGKVSDEAREVITLTRSGSRVDAFRVTQDIVGDLGDDAISIRGRFGSQQGRVVGQMSRDGRRGWRLDYDPTKGPHYNYFDHDRGIYGAVPFEGTQEQVDRLIDTLNSRYD